MSGQLVIWSIELYEYRLLYQPRLVIKEQALTDLTIEYSFKNDIQDKHFQYLNNRSPQEKLQSPPQSIQLILHWELYVDGSFNFKGNGVVVVLMTPMNMSLSMEFDLNF